MARNMKVCTITTNSDVVSDASNPPTLIGVEKTPTPYAKKPKIAKTFSTKSAKIFQSRDFYFRAPGSLVVLSFPQPLNFSSVLSKPLSETVTSARTAGCPMVEHL
jgi:hypothetical protein